MLIYVARHGESEDDLSNSYGGAANFPLTDRGREQVRELGVQLKGAGIQAIYHSPLARAHESAAIINEELGGLPMETIFDLRERNTYGVISGHTRERARELFGYLIDCMEEPPGKGRACVPGGEEYGPFIERVKGAFSSAVGSASAAGFDTFLLVTHGKFTLGLFTEVLASTRITTRASGRRTSSTIGSGGPVSSVRGPSAPGALGDHIGLGMLMPAAGRDHRDGQPAMPMRLGRPDHHTTAHATGRAAFDRAFDPQFAAQQVVGP